MNIAIPGLKHMERGSFLLIAGPCVVESHELVREVASELKRLSDHHGLPVILKASYRKANRSRLDSFKGIGDENALEILADAGREFELPLITDIHTPPEAEMAASFVDVLQIPAFLCRQTDLLLSAAATGKWINIKKGQFLSGESMEFAVQKVRDSGNNNIMLTERGNMFGYQDLVVDIRNIPKMRKFGVPVIMDITHSLQQPNQVSGIAGGLPEMIETISKASIAAGADGLFIETHPNPERALSDGSNMLALDKLDELIRKLIILKEAVNKI